MWGRWGFAPRLVADVATVRAHRRRPQLVLAVHEAYVPIHDARTLVMGVWQRFQLASLLLLVDRRFASIERWAAKLSRFRPTRHLPSGSNLPDARGERQAVRSELGLGDAVAVATLSTGHPSHLTAYVEASLARLAAEGVEVVFLQLGAGSSEVAVPSGVRVIRPGLLPAERLGALLAAADVLLTPFDDGVSTRRGSFLAGLCEGVAVVGTEGELTDSMLLGQGLELVRGRRRFCSSPSASSRSRPTASGVPRRLRPAGRCSRRSSPGTRSPGACSEGSSASGSRPAPGRRALGGARRWRGGDSLDDAAATSTGPGSSPRSASSRQGRSSTRCRRSVPHLVVADPMRAPSGYARTVRLSTRRMPEYDPTSSLRGRPKPHLYLGVAAFLDADQAPCSGGSSDSDRSLARPARDPVPADGVGCSSRPRGAQHRLAPRRTTFVVHPGVELDEGPVVSTRKLGSTRRLGASGSSDGCSPGRDSTG